MLVKNEFHCRFSCQDSSQLCIFAVKPLKMKVKSQIDVILHAISVSTRLLVRVMSSLHLPAVYSGCFYPNNGGEGSV